MFFDFKDVLGQNNVWSVEGRIFVKIRGRISRVERVNKDQLMREATCAKVLTCTGPGPGPSRAGCCSQMCAPRSSSSPAWLVSQSSFAFLLPKGGRLPPAKERAIKVQNCSG